MNTTVRQATEAGGPVGAPLVAPQVVLVPLLNMGLAGDMLGLAAHLTRDLGSAGVDLSAAQARIVVLSVVEVPPDQPLTMGLDLARSYRALLDFLPSQVEFRVAESQEVRYVRVDRVVKVARDISEAIRQAALEERAELLLLYWKGHAREAKHHQYGRIVDSVLANPPCSVMLTRVEGWSRARRVLLSVRGGPSAEQALGMSVALAERLNIPVTVLHNVPRAGTVPNLERATGPISQVEALGEEPYLVFNEQLRRMQESTSVPVESILTRMEDPVAAILSEAESDDIVIMGMAPQNVSKKSPDPESLALRVSQMKGSPLLLLNAPSEMDLGAYSKRLQSQRRGGKSRTDSKQWIDMPFEHWFVEHTYHGDEFRDAEEFLKAKQASGLTLSVVVLTSNDAAKIHSVIMGLRKVLQEMHPIAEQIVVVDAASTDGTPQIARELGAEVYSASEILSEQGDLHGRGESWWKSLAVAKGDIIVWVDPRARRFHPSTVLALAGPLLKMPTLQLIKAYEGTKEESRKPKGEEQQRRGAEEFSPVDMSWGGFVVPRRGEETHSQVRVQALRPSDLEALDAGQLAMLPPRTLFQVLCPSLAGVSAPFGKDMAARRDTMMNLPVYAGDGFEIGLLLSVATEYGTNTIAQVELGQGQPAAPPQPGLRGAVDLLQVMSGTLPDAGMRHYTEQITERLRREIEGKRTPSHESTDKLFEVRALGPVERQPMRSVLGDE